MPSDLFGRYPPKWASCRQGVPCWFQPVIPFISIALFFWEHELFGAFLLEVIPSELVSTALRRSLFDGPTPEFNSGSAKKGSLDLEPGGIQKPEINRQEETNSRKPTGGNQRNQQEETNREHSPKANRPNIMTHAPKANRPQLFKANRPEMSWSIFSHGPKRFTF